MGDSALEQGITSQTKRLAGTDSCTDQQALCADRWLLTSGVPAKRSDALQRAVLGRGSEELVVDKCLALSGGEEGSKEASVVGLGR